MTSEAKPPGKYTGAILGTPPAPEANVPEAEAQESKCYGYMLGNRQAIMLELRQVKGDRLALGYSYLVSAGWDGSGTLVLKFTGHRVTVTGRCLVPLFRRLVMHRVSFIQAVEALHATALPDSEPVVESITVEDV